MIDQKEIIECHFNEPDKNIYSNGFDIANPEIVKAVTCFHESLPGYIPTPLVKLSFLAKSLGVEEISIKDESKRFDLNAFKVLGASYAMARALMKELNFDPKKFTFEEILLHSKRVSHLTFVTATDGNHGRAVAWVASKFGCKAVVFMPKGTSKPRLHAIQDLGAKASILDCNYDEAVDFAEQEAGKNNWALIQDTSFPGYEEIPENIMQGYFTLVTEAMAQGENMHFTHVFVQAGVGSLSGAVLAHLCSLFGKSKPVFVLVEAAGAPCFYKSMEIGDGKPHTVHGDLKTIMAGLACGKPCQIGWEILKVGTDAFITCSDEIAKKGMRILGNPMGDDIRIISGESGAVTLGLVYNLLHEKKNKYLRNNLKIDANSKILLFSTEGDTDPQHYRKIVWQDE
ncbi:MAG: diaminopropionate ammonia-lyase [Desulfobacteraceae bacterium]|nr:diaminopropionate ammonia-lyase [Desulfobacteraceae bacterium]